MGIHIITDSASDIEAAARQDLQILPMTITFGEQAYRDGVDLSRQSFYEKLVESDTLPVTSQISPYQFRQVLEPLAERGEEAVVITMSSRLSGTHQSARMAAEGLPNVYVVDSENVTVGERVLVEYALRLKDGGAGAAGIAAELERAKRRVRMVALLDTLEYLKKGGRVSAAVAFAGGLLQVKPVVAIQEGEVVILGKARGSRQANNLIAQEIQRSGGVDFGLPVCLGYTGLSDALARKYIQDNAHLWEGHVDELPLGIIGGTIGTHAGPGAVAVGWFVPRD